MTDDVLINKAATIERCVKRAREEYLRVDDFFAYSKALLMGAGERAQPQ